MPKLLKKQRITVIDDDEGILEAFEAMLADTGYDITTIRSADSVLKCTKANIPDLIIMDVLLSGEDGRNICRDLKKAKLTKAIPIIMISAHPEAEKSVMESGADDYLKKPFEMDNLLSKVTKYLQ